MFDVSKLGRFLPTVEKPVYKLSLNKKLMWTGLVLAIYFLLSSQLFGRVYGVAPGAIQQFQMLQMLFGSTFGTLMTLGIGPIVTASIILQLMTGSKILDWDLTEPEQKKKYDTVQKLLAIGFGFLLATVYVLGGTVPPVRKDVFTVTIVILQLAIGGIIVMLLDEIISKYGIGSGISLFIAAGVTDTIFIGLFKPFTQTGDLPSTGNPPAGAFWGFIYGLLTKNSENILINFLPILSTISVFLLVVYALGITIDIPITFSAVRGFGRRWSLKLFYTSNIPVMLTLALLSYFQIFGNIIARPTLDDPNIRCGFLGCISQTQGGGGEPKNGLVYYLSAPTETILSDIIIGNVESNLLLRALTYTIFMVLCCVIFSIFWVKTSGMDAKSMADQLTSIGMQIPGYRKDPGIIKKVLNKYIPPLTVLGGVAIGFLAAFADFTGAIGTGTGILLTVTIIYDMYERIKSERVEQAHPLIRKMLGEE